MVDNLLLDLRDKGAVVADKAEVAVVQIIVTFQLLRGFRLVRADLTVRGAGRSFPLPVKMHSDLFLLQDRHVGQQGRVRCLLVQKHLLDLIDDTTSYEVTGPEPDTTSNGVTGPEHDTSNGVTGPELNATSNGESMDLNTTE